ncbi:MFS transporter [Streptomyces sp. R17]|uniref:MFS transporter n=2 Tax=unclassified Streptomyces TaxID=2593676 RepID=A0AB39P1H2_9ACTN
MTTPVKPLTAARPRLPAAVWALVCAVFVSSAGAGAIAPVLTERTAELARTAAVPGVVSAYFLARLVCTPIAGRLVTAGLTRRLLPAGLLLTALSTAGAGLAGDYWQLLGLRVVGGVGSTLFTVSAVALLVAAAPPRLRGRAFGVWSVGFEAGTVVGPMVGTGLFTLARSAPFTVTGLCLGLTAAALLFLPRRDGADDGETGGVAVRMRKVLAHRAYRAALLSNFAVGWGAYGIQVSLVPLFVLARFADGSALASVALTAFAVGNAVVLPVAGRLTDSWGRRPAALLGIALFGAGLGGIGLSGDPVTLVAAAVVTGVGCGVIGPAHGAAVADVLGPDARGGSALASFQLAADVGAVAGPVIAGVAAQAWSFPAAFLLTALVPAVAFVAWLRAPETLPAPARTG